MRYELVGIGRGRYNGTVVTDDEMELYRAVTKHLASRDVDILWDEAELIGTVVVGGFRPVGQVIRVQEQP